MHSGFPVKVFSIWAFLGDPEFTGLLLQEFKLNYRNMGV